ncbi:MAG: prepilin peptidase [Pseudomonadota bacterium]
MATIDWPCSRCKESIVILYALLFVFPAAMIMAALSDLRTLTIPNNISIALAITFLVLAPFAGLPLKDIGMHGAACALVLTAGIACFACGWLGGGDAKLLAAGALWVGFDQLIPFIYHVTLFGGILIVLILAYRWLVSEQLVTLAGSEWVTRLHQPGGGVPYGIAIASSAVLIFPDTKLYALIMA